MSRTGLVLKSGEGERWFRLAAMWTTTIKRTNRVAGTELARTALAQTENVRTPSMFNAGNDGPEPLDQHDGDSGKAKPAAMTKGTATDARVTYLSTRWLAADLLD